MKFGEVAVGADFIFQGKSYEKVALSMDSDEENIGNIFLGETEVTATTEEPEKREDAGDSGQTG